MFTPLLRFHIAKKCPMLLERLQFGVPALFRQSSQAPEYGKQLGGYEYKEEIEPFRKVNVKDTYLELKSSQNKYMSLNYEWLRENCRCDSCYNKTTNQRNIHIFNVNRDIHTKQVLLKESGLHVQWSDGHESQYTLDYLWTQSRDELRPHEVLWSGDMLKHVESVTAKEVHTKEGITRLVKSLLEFGVGFVTNVAPNLKATEDIIRCVGPPQQTLFGGMWEFTDKMDHLDTAYTNQALDVHNDTTYFIEPAGLIIFHCTKRNCKGGDTLLADGFRAANEVRLEAPDLYDMLKTVHTEFQYIDKEHILKNLSTIVHHTPNDQIKQIRYNLYDRSARMPFPASKCSLFYKSVRRLAAALNRPEEQWKLTLEPGTIAFINNWRVLHGRTAFNGERTITGAYVTMGDLLSCARSLQLIE